MGSVCWRSVLTRHVPSRRVSVVVAVPKILEVLRKHVLHQFPETADSRPVTSHWIFRWWRYRRTHRALGLEVLGHLWSEQHPSPENSRSSGVVEGYNRCRLRESVALND